MTDPDIRPENFDDTLNVPDNAGEFQCGPGWTLRSVTLRLPLTGDNLIKAAEILEIPRNGMGDTDYRGRVLAVILGLEAR